MGAADQQNLLTAGAFPPPAGGSGSSKNSVRRVPACDGQAAISQSDAFDLLEPSLKFSIATPTNT